MYVRNVLKDGIKNKSKAKVALIYIVLMDVVSWKAVS